DKGQPRLVAAHRGLILAQTPAFRVEQLDGSRPVAIHIGEDDAEPGHCRRRRGTRDGEQHVHVGTPDRREGLGLAERLELGGIVRIESEKVVVGGTEAGARAAEIGSPVVEEPRREGVDVGELRRNAVPVDLPPADLRGSPGAAPLTGSPNRARNCVTADVMSPVPCTIWNVERTSPAGAWPTMLPRRSPVGPIMLLPLSPQPLNTALSATNPINARL